MSLKDGGASERKPFTWPQDKAGPGHGEPVSQVTSRRGTSLAVELISRCLRGRKSTNRNSGKPGGKLDCVLGGLACPPHRPGCWEGVWPLGCRPQGEGPAAPQT